MAGAKMAGRPRRRAACRRSGSGPGGGGTGYGHIYGAGNLDTGGRGRQRQGARPEARRARRKRGLGRHGQRRGDTDGSLSKEQINKVVRAHLAGIKYCYEKELQRQASLSGGIDVFWIIQPDGTVSKANVKNTTDGRRRRRRLHHPPGQAVDIPEGARDRPRSGVIPSFSKGIGGRHDEAQSRTTRGLSLLALAGTAAAAWLRAMNAPLYFEGATIESMGDDEVFPTSGLTLRFRDADASRSGCRSTSRRAALGYDMDVPWISRDKVHIEITYRVTNLSDERAPSR